MNLTGQLRRIFGQTHRSRFSPSGGAPLAGQLSLTSSWKALGGVALIFALLCASLPPAPAEAAEPSRVLPQLLSESGKQPNKTFRILITRHKNDRAADAFVASNGGRKLKDVSNVGFAAELPGRAIAALSRQPSVKWVSIDAPMVKTGTVDTSKLGTVYTQAANASALAPTGKTGAGVGVAVVDTGIASGRPDFKTASAGSSRVVAKALFNSDLESTFDGHGHGTHVAGIIAGNSWWRSDTSLQGVYVGVAPEANLINVRVSNEAGMSYVSDVVNAIDWVIANRQTYNIRVLNLSLISSVAESYTTSMLSAAAEKAWFNGIFVVVAAGNAGANTMLYPPANDPFVVTVGAADPLGTASRADDGIAPWSSHGTTQDGFAKPEIVAPGRNIVAPLSSTSSTLGQQFPSRIVDGAYIRLSGTSMAAPVVAGIAALAFQAHPEWTNDQVKWLLLNTSTRLSTVSPAAQGAGQVDAAAVVNYSGTPQSANGGLKISSQLVGPNGEVNYSTSSWSTSSWSTSSWSTSSWSTSSWSTSSWSTSSWSTANHSTSSFETIAEEEPVS